jgi:hypothetical protein
MGRGIGGRSLAALALVLASNALAGCLYSGRTWSFTFTRDALDAMDRKDFEFQPPEHGTRGGACDVWIVPVVAFFPVIADVAMLPVTGVHDLCVR